MDYIFNAEAEPAVCKNVGIGRYDNYYYAYSLVKAPVHRISCEKFRKIKEFNELLKMAFSFRFLAIIPMCFNQFR